MTLINDHMPPELFADSEAKLKVSRSIISYNELTAGDVGQAQIENCFRQLGCGAALIKLEGRDADLYNRFYLAQWQLGTRLYSDSPARAASVDARFRAMDMPVRQLMLQCGVGVARGRASGCLTWRQPDLETFSLTSPLSGSVGRPLAANRQEFHPSVEWLIERGGRGALQRDEDPIYAPVASYNATGSAKTIGRIAADEVRLLEIYREWSACGPMAKQGHGNKLNGDIYYGAFRGRTHIDSGGTMTVLLGPGELRDENGIAANETTISRDLGGNLIVAPLGEKHFVSLPYRLPCGSPYVVVFFEQYCGTGRTGHPVNKAEPYSISSERAIADRQHRRLTAIDTGALGWQPTIHGVRRISNESFSRGQAVIHVTITDHDLA